jgi:hypothetical protein
MWLIFLYRSSPPTAIGTKKPAIAFATLVLRVEDRSRTGDLQSHNLAL